PLRPPAHPMHPEPVNVAAPPVASTKPACRSSRPSSPSSTASSACAAGIPLAMSRSPSGPRSVFAHACVATAPTPAFAHGTTAPTHGNFDGTATPRSPFAGSNPTIEKVIRTSSAARRPNELERGAVLLEVFEHVPRAERDGLERTLRDVDGHLALLRQELI